MNLGTIFFSLAALTIFGQSRDATPKPKVHFTTNLGSFVIELDPEAAPKTVENFIEYAKSGFYKETTFHRVISTFMVQGGGQTADGNIKKGRDPIINEAKLSGEKGLSNTRGTIAMARTSAPNSATSQFFINVVDNTRLDYTEQSAGYCVFGRVVEGMDTVDKIRDVQTGQGDRPIDPVIITGAKFIAPKARWRRILLFWKPK